MSDASVADIRPVTPNRARLAEFVEACKARAAGKNTDASARECLLANIEHIERQQGRLARWAAAPSHMACPPHLVGLDAIDLIGAAGDLRVELARYPAGPETAPGELP